MAEAKQKIALVIGSLPSVEEIDQFQLISEHFEVNVVSSESICGYLSQNSFFKNLTCVVLKDHDENPTFLPGLEQVLAPYDIVVIKERLGLYAYQALKAKWRHRFRLLVWIDNLNVWPAQDVDQMRTIRQEVCNAADGFLVHTKTAKEVLELEGIEPSRIFLMKPWVEKRIERNPFLRSEARKRLGLSESDLIVAYFGQIEWEESLKNLILASKIAINQEKTLKDRLKIVICGIGPYAPELKELFLNTGLKDCAVYYAPNRESMLAILQATDAIYLATQPSRDRVEGDPYRILTPLTHGIPLIASRSALIEEFCGKHRLDFCPYSPISLAKALKKLRKSPGLVKNIIEKNRVEIENRFDPSKIQNSMIKLFESFASKDTKIDETSLDHRVLEVEAKIRCKQYLEAIDIIESIFQMENVPVHHRANLFRLVGDCFAKLGDLDAAKEAYVQGADLDPYSAKLYIGLGTIGLMKGTSDTAVLHFQRAISLAPEDEMANLGLGLSFQGMGELEEALRWVNKALLINPSNSAAIFTLVKLAHETEDYKDCEMALRRYLQVNPNDLNIKYSLGGLLFKQDRFQEVVVLMKEILAMEENNERAQSLKNQAMTAIEELKRSSSNG